MAVHSERYRHTLGTIGVVFYYEDAQTVADWSGWHERTHVTN